MAGPFPAGPTAEMAPCRIIRPGRINGDARPLFETPRLPRLAVLAPSLADAVRLLGGWLFDQALGGLDAAVLTAEHGADSRAAVILGVRVRTLEGVPAVPLPRARFHSVAVHAGLFDRDPRVRLAVHDALDQGQAEVLCCGGPLPSEFIGAATPVRYRLSVAARAFKIQALAALPGAAAPTTRWPPGTDPAVEEFSRISARLAAE